jgi:ribosomal protein L9
MQREDKSIVERDYARFYFTQQWFLELFAYEFATANAKRMEQEKQQQMAAKDQFILPSRSQHNQSQETPTEASSGHMETPAAFGSVTETQVSHLSGEQPPQENGQSSFDFDLIANVMDLNMFWACMRRMRICLDDKVTRVMTRLDGISFITNLIFILIDSAGLTCK